MTAGSISATVICLSALGGGQIRSCRRAIIGKTPDDQREARERDQRVADLVTALAPGRDQAGRAIPAASSAGGHRGTAQAPGSSPPVPRCPPRLGPGFLPASGSTLGAQTAMRENARDRCDRALVPHICRYLVRRRGLQQRVELRDVQIVAGGDAFQAEMIFEIVRRDAVRHVQRKIPDAPRVREKFQVIVVADEIAVGVARADLLENPVVARFENARRGDEDGRLRVEG